MASDAMAKSYAYLKLFSNEFALTSLCLINSLDLLSGQQHICISLNKG
jgi:hypothetical protein